MSKHKVVSFIKSGIRIVGCLLGIIAFWKQFLPMHAFALLIVAEILGIVEEKFEIPAADSSTLESCIKQTVEEAGGVYLGRDYLCPHLVLVQNPATGSTIPISQEDITVRNVHTALEIDGVRAGSKGML